MVLKLKGKKDVPLYTQKVSPISPPVPVGEIFHINGYRERCGDLYHIDEKKKFL